MDWRQIFNLPKEKCQHVAVGLQHPKLDTDKVNDVGQLMRDAAQYAACNMAITFIDDDLLLASKPQKQPLFFTGYTIKQKVKWILVYGESDMNIMPMYTMNDLGITVEDLSKSRMVIQGFNLESQRAIGMICLELTTGDLSTCSIFHVNDS